MEIPAVKVQEWQTNVTSTQQRLSADIDNDLRKVGCGPV
jgi:hypothetical protein